MNSLSRIERKHLSAIGAMGRAGQVVHGALSAVVAEMRPGVTTRHLDAVAHDAIVSRGAVPNFLGYMGYPASICASVNDVVVHGIPGELELHSGDVISIDCGAIVDGWHGDSALTVVLEPRDPADVELSEACRLAMWAGIAAFALGNRVGDIGAAIEDSVGGRYGILRDYVGHGIGRRMHMPPDVPNYRTGERSAKLGPGVCLAIEPMIVRGGEETQVLDDDWTVTTIDGSRSAHWEHSVARWSDGSWVLTLPDGGQSELEARGVRVSQEIRAAIG